MDEIKADDFLGVGWSFPPRFEQSSNGIYMPRADEDIREAIFILLSTQPGERVMNPDFGCDLQGQVFKQIDNSTINEIKDLIATAILYFEPRVRLEEISVDTSGEMDGRLDIHLEYTVIQANSRTNMVYPFYFIEGTNL